MIHHRTVSSTDLFTVFSLTPLSALAPLFAGSSPPPPLDPSNESVFNAFNMRFIIIFVHKLSPKDDRFHRLAQNGKGTFRIAHSYIQRDTDRNRQTQAASHSDIAPSGAVSTSLSLFLRGVAAAELITNIHCLLCSNPHPNPNPHHFQGESECLGDLYC